MHTHREHCLLSSLALVNWIPILRKIDYGDIVSPPFFELWLQCNRCCWLSSLACWCELEISLLKLITREYKPMSGRPPTTYLIGNLKLCHVRWWFERASRPCTQQIVFRTNATKDETNLSRRTFRAVILNLCALELAATTSQTMQE